MREQYGKMEAKQMLEDAGYGKGQVQVDPAMLPERFKDAAHPSLPSVGHIVHYYDRQHENPRAAIVVRVTKTPIPNSENIEAIVDLTVFTIGDDEGVKYLYDVPGVVPGVKHENDQWWQWS